MTKGMAISKMINGLLRIFCPWKANNKINVISSAKILTGFNLGRNSCLNYCSPFDFSKIRWVFTPAANSTTT